MNKEIAKKAYDSAKEESEQEQINQLKEVIKITLQRIEDIKKQIQELQDEKKILELDVEDFKEGHLDRIEERQRLDKKAKKVSVVQVEKVIEHHYNYWYTPYVVTWIYPQPQLDNTVYYLGDVNTCSASSSCSSFSGATFTLTNSVASNNSVGTYLLNNKTIHLR